MRLHHLSRGRIDDPDVHPDHTVDRLAGQGAPESPKHPRTATEPEPAAPSPLVKLGHRSCDEELRAKDLAHLGGGLFGDDLLHSHILLTQHGGELGSLHHDEVTGIHQGGSQLGRQAAANILATIVGHKGASGIGFGDRDSLLGTRQRGESTLKTWCRHTRRGAGSRRSSRPRRAAASAGTSRQYCEKNEKRRRPRGLLYYSPNFLLMESPMDVCSPISGNSTALQGAPTLKGRGYSSFSMLIGFDGEFPSNNIVIPSTGKKSAKQLCGSYSLIL